MTAPFTGSPIAHPERKLVQTRTTHIRHQSEDVAQLLNMIKTGWSTARIAGSLEQILIAFGKDDYFFGGLLLESVANIRDGNAQFIFTRWDDQRLFHWYLVQIKMDDTLIIEEYVNPPDSLHIVSPHRLA